MGILRVITLYLLVSSLVNGQVYYNHPEIDWETFETDNFQIHFYEGSEGTAREGAFVAEKIYPFVTQLYEYEPAEKTDIVFLDTDDISNGAAYYYDNKILIWASPMDFELRGSHRWLQNVITHEFTHIVSMQKSMKAGLRFPGAYLQWIGYEDEKRKDVLYGYPNTMVSYAIPGTSVPPWLAEGTAQYMYEGADWDNWDTHRDMILRDRVINNKLLTLTEMNTFGKSGIGNESTYNAGYKFCRFIALSYGADKLKDIVSTLSSPLQFSVNNAIKKSIGISGNELYGLYKKSLEKGYGLLTQTMRSTEVQENEQLIFTLYGHRMGNILPIFQMRKMIFLGKRIFLYMIWKPIMLKISNLVLFRHLHGIVMGQFYIMRKKQNIPIRKDLNTLTYTNLT